MEKIKMEMKEFKDIVFDKKSTIILGLPKSGKTSLCYKFMKREKLVLVFKSQESDSLYDTRKGMFQSDIDRMVSSWHLKSPWTHPVDAFPKVLKLWVLKNMTNLIPPTVIDTNNFQDLQNKYMYNTHDLQDYFLFSNVIIDLINEYTKSSFGLFEILKGSKLCLNNTCLPKALIEIISSYVETNTFVIATSIPCDNSKQNEKDDFLHFWFQYNKLFDNVIYTQLPQWFIPFANIGLCQFKQNDEKLLDILKKEQLYICKSAQGSSQGSFVFKK